MIRCQARQDELMRLGNGCLTDPNGQQNLLVLSKKGSQGYSKAGTAQQLGSGLVAGYRGGEPS